jgi:hypothetical protein
MHPQSRAPEPARPAEPPKPRRDSHYTFGILLIVLGLLMLGDQLSIGFQPFGVTLDFGRLWPVILLVLGVGRFVSARSEGLSGGGYWLIFLGGLFLLHTYDILRLGESWPLFIVAGGLSLMFGRDGNCRRRSRHAG